LYAMRPLRQWGVLLVIRGVRQRQEQGLQHTGFWPGVAAPDDGFALLRELPGAHTLGQSV